MMSIVLETGFARPVSRESYKTSAVPAENEFGLGLMVGTIVSVTGKYWLTDQAALDFGLGFVGSPWTAIYADYLWHHAGSFWNRHAVRPRIESLFRRRRRPRLLAFGRVPAAIGRATAEPEPPEPVCSLEDWPGWSGIPSAPASESLARSDHPSS